MDEEDLIRRLQDGDPSSYETLVKTFGGRMLAVARRVVRDEGEAEDCVQEAFLQAFRNIGGFEGRSALGSWLHRIVVNAALMKLRQRGRRQEAPLDDSPSEFDERGMRKAENSTLTREPMAVLESREIQGLVRRAIDELPDDFRNVILFRDIEEYDTAETADLLGLSLAATKTRLHRARAALKRRLEKTLREQES